jgi:putative methyltransferase (TIGR04325 family)
MSLRRRLQANTTFRRAAKAAHDRLPFGLRRLAFTLWNTGILGRPRYAGIYKSFDDFPNPIWPPTDAEMVRSSLSSMQIDDASGLMIFRQDHAMLPLVAAMLGGRDLRVLDFGGAAGLDYIGLQAAAGHPATHYCVVERSEICKYAREAWVERGDHRVIFLSDLPPASERFDIVYAWGAVHYPPKPFDVLARFVEYQPRAILLVHHPVTKDAGFVRGQRGDGGYYCPAHVLGVRDIEHALPGYRLAFRGADDVEMNVDNFPPQYRVGRHTNLLFLPA